MAKVGSSTTSNSAAFIMDVWPLRKTLSANGQRGLAQGIYVLLCGHVEGKLCSMIEGRLYSVWGLLEHVPQTIPYMINRVEHSYDATPVRGSLRSILEASLKGLDSIALRPTMDKFDELFSQKLVDIMGKDLVHDILALGCLRNLFAHGRAFWVHFDGDGCDPGDEVDFDRSGNFKTVADRLIHARILSNPIIAREHHKVSEAIYSDAAVAYFYNAVQEFELKLDSYRAYVLEGGMIVRPLNPLPP